MVLSFLKNMFNQRGDKYASFLLALLSALVIAALYFNQNLPAEKTVTAALLDLTVIITLSIATFYLTSSKGLYIALSAAILCSVIAAMIATFLFGEGYGVRIIYPILAVIFALMTGGIFRYLVHYRSGTELRSIFSSYQSDKFASRLIEEHDAANAGGDSRDVTIMFTDIKDFTSFSEKHTPQEVVDRLNEYLGEMVQVIEEYEGYVDKFIGDGIMAYWGAPLAQADHANLAIACLLAMNKSMDELRVKWLAAGAEPFAIRAGIQSGEVVAGNVGLRGKKMEYTVIGDTVNQAARLEGSAKYYGVDALIGENTYLRTCSEYRYRELDKIRMVGKQVPVTVYELIGVQSDGINQLNRQFAVALSTYRALNWEAAEKQFANILADFPDDRPSAMYLERCQYFRKNPVTPGWDGVFNRRGK